MKNIRIAVIRIKGNAGLNKDIKDTFRMLRLYKKHNCIVVPNSPQYVGMIEKIKHSATWGEIDIETFRLLLQKRGKLPGKENLTEDYLKDKLKTNLDTFVKDFMEFKKELNEIPGLKLFFKLNPPRSGFEEKGTKVPFSLGGALGYRKDKINELIKKMI